MQAHLPGISTHVPYTELVVTGLEEKCTESIETSVLKEGIEDPVQIL